jgi:hypothetical protein
MSLRSAQPLYVGLAIALALAGCGSAKKLRANENRLIVLDHSIGGVALQETRAQVERRLGSGFVLRTQDQKPPEPRLHVEDVLYAKDGLDIGYVSHNSSPSSLARGRVVVVLTQSPRYRTPAGIHVGSSATRLRTIKGLKCFEEECQHGFKAFNHRGTSFRLDYPDGKVIRIAIAYGH